MAVALVDKGDSDVLGTGTLTKTCGINPSGIDRILLVWVHWTTTAGDPSSVVFGAAAMTQIAEAGGNNIRSRLYMLLNPTAGEDTVTATWGDTAGHKAVRAIALSGADQITPAIAAYGGDQSANNNNLDQCTISSQTGDFVAATILTDGYDETETGEFASNTALWEFDSTFDDAGFYDDTITAGTISPWTDGSTNAEARVIIVSVSYVGVSSSKSPSISPSQSPSSSVSPSPSLSPSKSPSVSPSPSLSPSASPSVSPSQSPSPSLSPSPSPPEWVNNEKHSTVFVNRSKTYRS